MMPSNAMKATASPVRTRPVHDAVVVGARRLTKVAACILGAPFVVASISRRTRSRDIDNSGTEADAITIERVEAATDDVVRGLTEVLIDAVHSGAGVSFMSDFTSEQASTW